MKTAISRENNFDFLRLLLASFVILSHSYLIIGQRENEAFALLTNRQTAFGGFAVDCFFIISGYLIYQSLIRSSTLKGYFWKRFLRLFPGLFVMLVIVLVIVPFIYEGNGSVFQQSSYWTYLPRQLTLINIQNEISGVFQNLPSKIVNGTLWTLYYEFLMYILLGALFFIPRKWHFAILLAIFLLSGYLSIFAPETLNKRFFSKIFLWSPKLYMLCSLFVGGALLSFIDFSRYKYPAFISVVSFLVLVLSFYFNIFYLSKIFILPILIISLGVQSTPYVNKMGYYLGDVSYGLYIYGWVVQQLLMLSFEIENVHYMNIFALIISFIVSYFSWHWVEKRALKLKDIVR